MQYAKNAADDFAESLEDWLRNLDEKYSLTPAAHEVVQAVINDPRHASFASAAELAKKAEVNVATITRTAQSLGFSGWGSAIRTMYGMRTLHRRACPMRTS